MISYVRIIIEYPFFIARDDLNQRSFLLNWLSIASVARAYFVLFDQFIRYLFLFFKSFPESWIWYKLEFGVKWLELRTALRILFEFMVCWFSSNCNFSSWNFGRLLEQGQPLRLKPPFSNCSVPAYSIGYIFYRQHKPFGLQSQFFKI